MAAPRRRGVGPGLLVRAIGRLALLVSLGFAAGLVIGVAIEEPRLLLGHLRGESESVRLVEAPFAEQEGDDLADRQPAALERGEFASEDSHEASQLREPQVERLALRDLESQRAREAPAVAAPAASATPARSEHVMHEADGRVDDFDVRTPDVRDLESQASANANANATVARDSSRWAIQVGAFADERSALGLVDQLTAKRYPVDLIPSDDRKNHWRVRIQPIRGKAHAQEIANRLKQEDGLPTWLILLEADAR